MQRPDLAARLDPVAHLEPHVQHRHIRIERMDSTHRLVLRARLTDHLDVALGLEQFAHTPPDDLVVVEEEHRDPIWHRRHLHRTAVAMPPPGRSGAPILRVVGTFGPGPAAAQVRCSDRRGAAAMTTTENSTGPRASRRALVVYESMFGNTEAIARSIGEGLAERASTPRCWSPSVRRHCRRTSICS